MTGTVGAGTNDLPPETPEERKPMYKIVRHEVFSPTTFLWEVEAPDVAKAAQAGHFVMLRLREGAERIPLTVADYDREAGTIRARDGSSSRWLARPIRCTSRDDPLGAAIWITRSTSPQSMPRSSVEVQTTARRSPRAIAASTLRLCSAASEP